MKIFRISSSKQRKSNIPSNAEDSNSQHMHKESCLKSKLIRRYKWLDQLLDNQKDIFARKKSSKEIPLNHRRRSLAAECFSPIHEVLTKISKYSTNSKRKNSSVRSHPRGVGRRPHSTIFQTSDKQINCENFRNIKATSVIKTSSFLENNYFPLAYEDGSFDASCNDTVNIDNVKSLSLNNVERHKKICKYQHYSVVTCTNQEKNIGSDDSKIRDGRHIRLSLYEIGFGRWRSYQRLERLGEGTYATVYKGKSLLTGQIVALKEIRLEHDEGAPCTAIREASVLRQLRHANIVTLHDVVYETSTLTLVFEYVKRDLKQYLEKETDGFGIIPFNVRLFMYQLLRGLAYCHQQKIIHRDLKPQNILLNSAGQLKLADFGLARLQTIPSTNYSNEVVTLWYRPPDVLQGSTCYSTSIDIWGVGCIFGEMLQGRPMFPGTTDDQLNLIHTYIDHRKNETILFKMLVTLVPNLMSDNDGLHLLSKLLRSCPEERISAVDAMHHKYFSNYYNIELLDSLPPHQSVTQLTGMCARREFRKKSPERIFQRNESTNTG
ncbi:hypothetical protein GJ496_011732 [Pomphorhynchus laevis]|nr:hypothetical protein GJ496_011732 [Pomphorhynchus laevis]